MSEKEDLAKRTFYYEPRFDKHVHPLTGPEGLSVITRVAYNNHKQCLELPLKGHIAEGIGSWQQRPHLLNGGYARMLAANSSIVRTSVALSGALSFNGSLSEFRMMADYAKRCEKSGYQRLSDHELQAMVNLLLKLSPKKHRWADFEEKRSGADGLPWEKYIHDSDVYHPEMVARVINGDMILHGKDYEKRVIDVIDAAFVYLHAGEEYDLKKQWNPVWKKKFNIYDWAKQLSDTYESPGTHNWGEVAYYLGKMAMSLGCDKPGMSEEDLRRLLLNKGRLYIMVMLTKTLNAIRLAMSENEEDRQAVGSFFLGESDHMMLTRGYSNNSLDDMDNVTTEERKLAEILENPATKHLINQFLYKQRDRLFINTKRGVYNETMYHYFPKAMCAYSAAGSCLHLEPKLCRLEGLDKGIADNRGVA